MEYFNNLCKNCRLESHYENKKDDIKCNIPHTQEDDLILIDYNKDIGAILDTEEVDIEIDELCIKKCYSFDDMHRISGSVLCDYIKYSDEMNIVRRLIRILNADLGTNQFEGAIADYMRTKANRRLNEEER